MAWTTKYVTTTGTEPWATNSQGNPSSITEAAANAADGEWVKVQDGTYTLAANLVFANGGTVGNGIVYEGVDSSWNSITPSRTGAGGNGPLDDTDCPVIACGSHYMSFTVASCFHIFKNIKFTASNTSAIFNSSATDSGIVMGCVYEQAGSGSAVRCVNLDNEWTFYNCDFECSGSIALYVVDADSYLHMVHCRIIYSGSGTCSNLVMGTSINVIVGCLLANTGSGTCKRGYYDPSASNVRTFHYNTIYNCTKGHEIVNAAVTAWRGLWAIGNNFVDCGTDFYNGYVARANPIIAMGNMHGDYVTGKYVSYGGFVDLVDGDIEITDGSADTDFENASAGDFRLKTTADAFEAGIVPPWSIGAYQSIDQGGGGGMMVQPGMSGGANG